MAEPIAETPRYDKLTEELKLFVDDFIDKFRTKSVARGNLQANTPQWLANMREGAAIEVNGNPKYKEQFRKILLMMPDSKQEGFGQGMNKPKGNAR